MPAPLPFQISPEAEAHIRERLHAPPGMQVALVRTLGYEERNPKGRVIMRFPHEFLTVGYYEPGDRPTALQVKMFGAMVSIIPDTLERLRGQRLTIRTEVYRHGWFSRTRRQFLMACPC
jgi:hypothetical protein